MTTTTTTTTIARARNLVAQFAALLVSCLLFLRQDNGRVQAFFVIPAASSPYQRLSSTSSRLQHQSSSSATSTEHSTTSTSTSASPSVSSSTSTEKSAAAGCCFPTTVPWEVHKFGGASLATAELYRTVGDLLLQEARRNHNNDSSSDDSNTVTTTIPTMAVVSARGGMTDLLVKVVDSALQDFDEAETALQQAVESQIQLLQELAPLPAITDPIEARFRQDARDILSVVQSLRMLHTVPAVTMEVVTGFGEIWSAQTLAAYLQTALGDGDDNTSSCEWMDARDVLIVKSTTEGLGEKGAASTAGVTPLWDETAANMRAWWDQHCDNDNKKPPPSIVVVTGFVAKTATGVPTTLKRSGSDYSATIFGKLVHANRITFWKNTNGVYTADPRAVPEAFPIASLKYDEALELAYFGAQVLHPSAMLPCIESEIPVYVRNIFNPAFAGTVIQGRAKTLREAMATSSVKNWRAKSGEIPIKGITSVDKTALVTLEGTTSVMGGANVAERFMGAMANANVNVLIITQASSESSITVAVPEAEGPLALAALQDTFELELARSTIGSVSLATGMSIVAIVGEGMALTSGVSSTFMGALARANVNIRLIAQGSSELQVAVVVKESDASRALRAAHMAFTLSETVASVALLGSRGHVGTALCKQMESTKEKLAQDLGVGFAVNVAACSTRMAFCKDSRGLDVGNLCDRLSDDDEALPFDLEQVTHVMEADVNPLRVIVDCTNSDEVADYYERWLSLGISIISPGRKVGAGDLERYSRVCQAQKDNSVSLYLESSVGTALPIISTARDLEETGDTIKTIEGALSGTMAFVLSTFSEKVPFSESVRQAVAQSIPENDVRVDLSGLDMAQKVVILARQVGLPVSLEDVEVENFVPDDIVLKSYNSDDGGGDEALLEDIRQHMDEPMLERLKAAEADGLRLRYKFSINLETKECKCWLACVSNTEPIFRLKRNENLVAFETSRYETSPLIVKGAAAGPDLAAAGIFADLLRLTRAYSSNQG